MQLRDGIHLSFVMSGRYIDEEDYNDLKEANPVPPRFGFNWWFWKPVFKNNFKDARYMNGLTLSWLCFILDYTDFN